MTCLWIGQYHPTLTATSNSTPSKHSNTTISLGWRWVCLAEQSCLNLAATNKIPPSKHPLVTVSLDWRRVWFADVMPTKQPPVRVSPSQHPPVTISPVWKRVLFACELNSIISTQQPPVRVHFHGSQQSQSVWVGDGCYWHVS